MESFLCYNYYYITNYFKKEIAMKIATWNVERWKHKSALGEMRHICDELNADILVLTETDSRLHPDYRCDCHTPLLFEQPPLYYKLTENSVSIFTNYPCVSSYTTYDANTSLCIELKTEIGDLCSSVKI